MKPIVMRPPDATADYQPDPGYLRGLQKTAGLTQEEIAVALGVSCRAVGYYLSLKPGPRQAAPYAFQYGLEALARAAEGGQGRPAPKRHPQPGPH